MIINKQRDDVQSNGFDTGKQFGIEMSAKAYDILFDKLYSDSVSATIREICCNAYDAHVDDGNTDTPFEVVLPTAIDPVFVVKDYGTGMSPEQVENLYSTLFMSTKDKSNDFIGAMGIGSKTPFALSDTFRVQTRYNGLEHDYMAFKDDSGIPFIQKMSEKPSDEHNGMTISVPVNSNVIKEFKRKVDNILMAFDTKILLNGVEYDNYVLDKCEEVLDNVYSCDSDNFYDYSGDTLVLCGSILYKIDRYADDPFNTPYGKTTIIKVDIGDVDVSSSRESLDYTDRTKQCLEKFKTKATVYFDNIIHQITKYGEYDIRDVHNVFKPSGDMDGSYTPIHTDVDIDAVNELHTTLFNKLFIGSDKLNIKSSYLFEHVGPYKLCRYGISTQQDKADCLSSMVMDNKYKSPHHNITMSKVVPLIVMYKKVNREIIRYHIDQNEIDSIRVMVIHDKSKYDEVVRIFKNIGVKFINELDCGTAKIKSKIVRTHTNIFKINVCHNTMHELSTDEINELDHDNTCWYRIKSGCRTPQQAVDFEYRYICKVVKATGVTMLAFRGDSTPDELNSVMTVNEFVAKDFEKNVSKYIRCMLYYKKYHSLPPSYAMELTDLLTACFKRGYIDLEGTWIDRLLYPIDIDFDENWETISYVDYVFDNEIVMHFCKLYEKYAKLFDDSLKELADIHCIFAETDGRISSVRSDETRIKERIESYVRSCDKKLKKSFRNKIKKLENITWKLK